MATTAKKQSTPLGDLIRRRRVTLKRTQAEVAKAAYLCRLTIVEIESGKQSAPTVGTLLALSRALALPFATVMRAAR